ncbi:transporter substrate-binding domain-containing protein [Pseudoalteromonas sp. MMG005]|uniref:transporter substrate-binding domain-containing protein n=1 Tax=Pseudoalteromonas sp. MMG005 TaxID=2822682 RepID=UPI001B39ED1D|nr:transporter substrate-binding domain-containing protein [Pseudoalteromonas sp. MMG005]MBQ4848199.1 transporter substrate-binding domain-containing protein [Pseudoalteromonas sp. MMG005]
MKWVVIFIWLFHCNVIAQSDTYSFCFSRWWPFSFVEDAGEAKGIQVDLLKYVLNNHNISVSFTELPYKRCIDDVLSGKYDFTLHLDHSDSLNLVEHGVSVWEMALAVNVNNQFLTLQKIKSLPLFSVVIAQEYPYPKAALKTLADINAVIIKRSYYEGSDEDAKALFDILSSNRVGAVLVDRRWAEKIISQFNLPVSILPELVHSQRQFIGYSDQNHEKAVILSGLLKAVSEQEIHAIEMDYQ